MNRCAAVINRSNLRHNVRQIRARARGADILAIVKANAYGHGITSCAQLFRSEGVKVLGVAYADEAAELRRAGDTGRILVLTPPFPEEARRFCELGLEFVVCSDDTRTAFNAEALRRKTVLKAHLYLDTGLHRDGIDYREALPFMESCHPAQGIAFQGLCTHFATSDEADKTFLLTQVERFETARKALHAAGYSFADIHASNSGALSDVAAAHYSLVRAGSALYGYNASTQLQQPLDLRPALRFVARINAIRSIEAGESVSYGRRFTASEPTKIATIAVGYGDGLHRSLSGRLDCLVGGRRLPIVGTICMDECMADIGDAPVNVGDEAVFIGCQQKAHINAQELAEAAATIHYEILSSIAARVPRLYVDEAPPLKPGA